MHQNKVQKEITTIVEYQKEITKQLEAKARIAEAETQKEEILLKRLQIEMKNNSNSKKKNVQIIQNNHFYSEKAFIETRTTQ